MPPIYELEQSDIKRREIHGVRYVVASIVHEGNESLALKTVHVLHRGMVHDRNIV